MSAIRQRRAPYRGGRHAAEEPAAAAVPPPTPWWRRLVPRDGGTVAGDRQVVLRVRGDLDDVGAARLADHVRTAGGLPVDQVLVVHLGECAYVNARGFRALLQLHDHVARHEGRLLVLDPPRTLRIMCRAAPCGLVLVPAGIDPGPSSARRRGQVR